MYIGPVKKINGAENLKNITYYYNRGYDKSGKEIFEKKKEIRRPQFKLDRKPEDRPKKYYQTDQMIYYIESIKIRGARIHRKLNSKDSEDMIPEHKLSFQSRIRKMVEAYNQKSKKMSDLRKRCVEDIKEDNIENKDEQRKIPTKQEEMKEFKDSLKQKEKTDLDRACEEFERALRKRSPEEIKEIQRQCRRDRGSTR